MSFTFLPKKVSNDRIRAQAKEALADEAMALTLPNKSGTYRDSSHVFGGSIGTTALTAGTVYLGVFAVVRPTTVDQVSLEITTAAASGNHLRVGLGVWAMAEADPWRADDIAELFESLADTTGAKFTTFNYTFEPGVLYAPIVHAEANVTVRGVVGGRSLFGTGSGTNGADANLRTSGTVTRAYGALPSTLTATSSFISQPRVHFRVA